MCNTIPQGGNEMIKRCICVLLDFSCIKKTPIGLYIGNRRFISRETTKLTNN